MNEQTTSVVVVGAGPVGCTLALELARHGVHCTVVERTTESTPHPKMDFLNARSMELLRRLGVSDAIREEGVGAQHPFDFHWIDRLGTPPITVWRYPSVSGMRERYREHNDGSAPWEPYQRLQGSLLERLLRERVRALPEAEVHEGTRVTSLTQDADGVELRLVDEQGRSRSVRASYVVGCDGAGSVVRRSIGIDSPSIAPPAPQRDVYFRSADPRLREHGRFFLGIAGRGLVLVSRDERDTWTASFPRTTDAHDDTDPVDDIRSRVGVDLRIDEVINVVDWEGTLAVAERYRSGRVFLAGDAAHQFFPTGGHGANTGIADAVDLGWKLAAVIRGWGGPRLLDSYEPERRPVAVFNREMSANLLDVWRRYFTLFGSGVSSAHLAGYLEQQSFQIDNVGIHFGYRYADSPVVHADDGTPPRWTWRGIVPTTWPGCRAPSVRLADGTELFDLLSTGYTLVDFTEEGAGKPLVDDATRAGIPMVHLPCADDHARTVWERDLVLVRPDQHVAWRASGAPYDWDAVLRRVTGRHR
ncbi:FAD-dependent monooxygenase [Saccharomonospora azurea]|uniref:FAD-dependent monooxygenase n=1 Tax=Saccharomonospora azurea TaxID=40988 RepID=UPI003D8C5E24